jgi:hypothetical protein
MDAPEENLNQLNIEINEETAEGIYSNLAIISHSNAEFILDFIRVVPGVPKARVKARVIMTPQHMKRLYLAMQDNIQKFETQFGKIELHDMDMGMPQMNFSGPTGMA